MRKEIKAEILNEIEKLTEQQQEITLKIIRELAKGWKKNSY